MIASRSMVVLFAAVVGATPLAAAHAGEVTYKYREEDGTVWFTDHRPRGASFENFEFLGYHGRPPATASCKGMTPETMAARARRVATPLRRYADRFEVDEQLVRAMMAVESCFDRFAISRVGARGLMQLMPATARALGVSNAFDPEQNIRGGIQYFSQMLERFSGDITRAVAAYNAGPRAVEHYEGVPPYDETRDYVRRVMKRWSQYREQSTR